MIAPLIETARLTMRPYRLSDWERLAAFYESDAARYVGGPLPGRAPGMRPLFQHRIVQTSQERCRARPSNFAACPLLVPSLSIDAWPRS